MEAQVRDIIITFNEPYFKTLEDIRNMDIFVEIENTKQVCKDIDSVLQRVERLDRSRETSLAITKLQEATMWLHANVKRLGEVNPYNESCY